MIKGLLSIVIPTYNSERFIFNNLQQIYSALESRQENFEIIIIDDGSSDKTSQELLRFYQRNYLKNVTLVPLRHLKIKGKEEQLCLGSKLLKENMSQLSMTIMNILYQIY